MTVDNLRRPPGYPQAAGPDGARPTYRGCPGIREIGRRGRDQLTVDAAVVRNTAGGLPAWRDQLTAVADRQIKELTQA